MRAINGIEAVELLASADPALAAATRQRGRVPVFERTTAQPSVVNGIEGVIFGTSASGPGSTIRLDSADPALALAARQRGQRVVVVVDSSGAVVPSAPAAAWYESASYATLSHVADLNNDRYAMPLMGSELVTNGGFDTDTDWTKTNTVISGGVATVTAGGSNTNVLTQAATLTAGALYEVTFTVTAFTAGTIRFRFAGGSTVGNTSRGAAGTYVEYLTAVSGNNEIQFNSNASFTGSIDNVSVKEIVLTPTGRTYGSELIQNGDFAAAALGSELLTNGGFDTDLTGWTSVPLGTGTATWNAGAVDLTQSSDANRGRIVQAITTVVGLTYQITTVHSGGNISPAIGTTSTGSEVTAFSNLTPGTNTRSFVATNTTTYITLVGSGSSFVTHSVDSVTVKQANWLLKNPAVGTETMNISGGELRLTGDGTNAAYADQSFTTVNGQVYELSVQHNTGNVITISVGTSQGGTQLATTTTPSTAATYVFKFTATGTTSWIRISRLSTGTATEDNVSIRALTAVGTYPKREATFDECFAFTAASDVARTYTDVNGVLKNDLAVNARRMTYANGKRQLRLENAGTNLALRSQEFDNAAWTLENATVTANAIAAPDGQTTADLFLEAATTSTHRVQPATGVALTAIPYTYSIFAKKYGTRRYIVARTAMVTGGFLNTTFDLDTGTVTYAGAGHTATITSYGNGWYRLTTTATSTVVSTRTPGFWGTSNANVLNDTAPSFAGSTSEGVYLWGAQFEANAFVTDYIPTTSASVTRAIETARFSPAVEAVLQRAQATVLVRAQGIQTPVGGILVGTSTTTNLLQAVSTTTLSSSVGAPVATIGSAGTVTAAFGGATGYDASGRSVVGNGGTVASDVTAAPTRTTIYLGRSDTNTAGTYGHGYYDLVGFSPERLPNTNLQALAVAAT